MVLSLYSVINAWRRDLAAKQRAAAYGDVPLGAC